MSKLRLVVLVSGNGSNLQALIDACETGVLHSRIVAVVSNRKGAYGLERASRHGIPTHYVPLKPYSDRGKPRAEYDTDLAELLNRLGADLLVLAGWMHVFTPAFFDHYREKVINLHPSLPGEYAGPSGIEWAYGAYCRGEIGRSGCMVHYVIAELDAGEPVLTREVKLYPHDTLETFTERMHEAEHTLIVDAVKLFERME
jgi:formyltetrahydrofolate-dependent phosphoribosylglycinamide formyltransferase